MKITALQEYGMRCLLQLAEREGTKPIQIRTIAEKEGLSADYVGKILMRLRRYGFVKSVRGLNGGYVLSRTPEKISVGEALMSLSEKPVQLKHLKRDLCAQFPGNLKECVHLRACNVRKIWSIIILQVYGNLNRIPLSTLLGDETLVQSNLSEIFSSGNPAAAAPVPAAPPSRGALS